MASTVAAVREHAHLYRVLVGARIRADWQYRTSFILFTVTQFLITFIDFLQIAVIFGRVPHLAGWSLAEVAFLYGLSGVAFFLGDVFISQVERAPQRIRMGTFDVLLIRPLGALFQLCTDEFAFRRFGKLVQASIILVIAARMVDVSWTPAKLGMLVVTIAAGTLIFSSIWIATSALAFWLVEGQELANTFTYGGNFATQYPIEILGTWLRRLLTFVVPTAFVNYFPALYLLDRANPFGLPGWIRFASPAVAVAAVLVARATWNLALRHYRSTGS